MKLMEEERDLIVSALRDKRRLCLELADSVSDQQRAVYFDTAGKCSRLAERVQAEGCSAP